MRRIVAATLLSAALFTAAGCADKPESSGTPTPSAATGLSKEDACVKLKAATDEFEAKGQALFTQIATDPSKAEAAMPELVAAFTAFQTSYGADLASISDPELKAAVEADLAILGKMVTVVTGSNGDPEKLMTALSDPEFEKAGDEVKKLCGWPAS